VRRASPPPERWRAMNGHGPEPRGKARGPCDPNPGKSWSAPSPPYCRIPVRRARKEKEPAAQGSALGVVRLPRDGSPTPSKAIEAD
jgi:hypothetical protein